jgi:hypothetical protein
VPIQEVGGHPALARGVPWTAGQETPSKSAGRSRRCFTLDPDGAARGKELEHIRAERCRICGLDDRDIATASEVRR